MEVREALSVDEIDLSDIEGFWTRPLAERDGAFKTLREQRPIAFFEEPDLETDLIPKGRGYYALTKHAHILEASRQPELFCSGKGATSIIDMPEVMLDFFGSMINMDDPRHARMRRIVARGFTPRMLAKVEQDVQRAAAECVDRVIEKGECDFVTEVASRLPLKIICDMMGIPERDYDFIFERSNVILSNGDPEYIPEGSDILTAFLTAGSELSNLVQELGKYRRDNPIDDLTSALVNAELDGEKLDDQELGSFFILLVVAGNETTRNAISHGMKLLTDHPDQRKAWIDDFEAVAPTAVEEIVRVASPVIWMRRTVTTDGARIGDQEFTEGDKLILFYNSANRDADVFDDPFTFDVRRNPNPHVGFGGPGPHFCLGAHLARREITVMFRELLQRVPDIHATSEPDRLRSNFINGIKHLPVAFGRAA
ncbi:MAG TPA: cytochrome P450 [Acidimicrobiales bacterium]|nr:cytochrome P450 [Acidimicrobiales bacterium]